MLSLLPTLKTRPRKAFADEPHSAWVPATPLTLHALVKGFYMASHSTLTGLQHTELPVKQKTRSFNQGPPPTWTDRSVFLARVALSCSPSAEPAHLCAGRNPLALFSLFPNPPGLVWPQTPVWLSLHSVREEQCLEVAYLRLKGHLPSRTNDSIQTESALKLDTEIIFLPRGKPEGCHL